MKKKWLALMLASTMLFSVACSDKSDDKKDNDKETKAEKVEDDEKEEKDDKKSDDKKEDKKEDKEDDKKDDSKETEAEESEPEETEPEETEAPKAEGTEISCTYWTATIPDTVTYEEDKFSDKASYTYHTFKNVDEEDKTLGYISITVDECDALEYRKSLRYNVSLEDYAADKLDKVTIAGIDFINYDASSWGAKEDTYFYRDESAGLIIKIVINGDIDSQPILDTIKFDIPDNGKVDAPWPWEGEPFVVEPATVDIAGYSVTATQLVADDSFLAMNIFDNRIAVVDSTLYALDDEILRIYNIDGDTLALANEEDLGRKYTHMCQDKNGNVYLSDFGADLLVYNGGARVNSYDLDQKFVIAPDGSYGLTFFMDINKLTKVTLNDDGTFEETEFTVDNPDLVSSVHEINLSDRFIFISGTGIKFDDTSSHVITVFDLDGNYKMTLCADPDAFINNLGSMTTVADCGDYIVGLDGNLRDFVIWSTDGTWLGNSDTTDLFGTHYPWICGLSQANGTLYVSLTEERVDGSWDEMVMYRVDIAK